MQSAQRFSSVSVFFMTRMFTSGMFLFRPVDVAAVCYGRRCRIDVVCFCQRFSGSWFLAVIIIRLLSRKYLLRVFGPDRRSAALCIASYNDICNGVLLDAFSVWSLSTDSLL